MEVSMLGQNRVHANFSVDDLAAARDFYTKKLGFRVVEDTTVILMLEGGEGTRINIYEKPDHEAWDSTVLGIEVNDVHDAVRLLKDVSIETAKIEGTDEDGVLIDPDMGRAAWFTDPAGNWVCISDKSS